MKFDFYNETTLKQVWLGNLKWAITIFVRFFVLFVVLWMFILTALFLKPYLTDKWNPPVVKEKTINKSQVSKTQYDKEIKDIDSTITMLKGQ